MALIVARAGRDGPVSFASERDYVYIGAVGVWSRRDITPRHVEWCCAVDNLSEFLSKQGVKA